MQERSDHHFVEQREEMGGSLVCTFHAHMTMFPIFLRNAPALCLKLAFMVGFANGFDLYKISYVRSNLARPSDHMRCDSASVLNLALSRVCYRFRGADDRV